MDQTRFYNCQNEQVTESAKKLMPTSIGLHELTGYFQPRGNGHAPFWFTICVYKNTGVPKNMKVFSNKWSHLNC